MSVTWVSFDINFQVLISGLSLATLLYIIRQVLSLILSRRADKALGELHGCSPPPEMQNQWPLGLDWLTKLFKADSKMHLLDFLCSVADNYEPRNMLSQYLLVGPRAYHILDPPNLETVLSTNFNDYGFGVRDEVFAPLLGTGIHTQEGPAWKHSRELLRKQFSKAQYRNLEPFKEHVDNLISRISQAKTQVVDLQPLFLNLTLDTTTAMLFGRSTYSLRADNDIDKANLKFAENFNVAQAGLAKRFRLAPWHSLYSPHSFRKACSEAHSFVEKYIEEEHIEANGHDKANSIENFIAQLLAESTSKRNVRDQLLNILLGGRDTTACCLSWTMRLLVRHPTTLERLRREVVSVVESCENPTREHIRKMPYLSFVIKESLRLFPPIPLNNRTAKKTTLLPRGGGPDGKAPILVRKGELVVFSQYVNSRRKNIFGPDADIFRPERWEECKKPDQFGWAYFPFSGGPRACLGQDFALLEVSYTIVRLLQAFPRIRLPADEDAKEILGKEKQRLTLVLLPADGCKLDFGGSDTDRRQS